MLATVTNLSAQQAVEDTVMTDQGKWYIVTRGPQGAVVAMRQINAPAAPADTTAAPAKQTARQSAMNIFGKETSRGCAHVTLYTDTPKNRAKNRVGTLKVSNCNGFVLSAGPAADILWGESELGAFNDQSFGGEFELGYRWHMLTPYARLYEGSKVLMDGRESRSETWTFGLKFAPAYHWVCSPYIAADYSIRNTSSKKEATIPGYELSLPYKGKAGSFGAEFGIDFYIGGFCKTKSFSDGEYRYKYLSEHKCYLTWFVNYHHNNVDKLKAEQSESTMRLNTIHTGLKLSVIL